MGKRKLNINWGIELLLLPIFIAGGVIVAQRYMAAAGLLLVMLMLVAAWIISWFKYEYYVFLLLAFLLPFSIEISLAGGWSVNFPSELIVALALFTLGWGLLNTPGLLKELFSGEVIWGLPLVASFIITSIFSSNPWVSLKFSVVNITYILLFLVGQKYYFKVYPKLFPQLLSVYSISFFIVLGYAFYRFAGYDWNPMTIKGIFQPFYKDNTIVGATSAILAAFWLGYAQKTELWRHKLLYWGTGTIFLLGVLLSNSRAAILSLFVFAMVGAIVKWQVRLKYILLVGAIGAAVLYFFNAQVLGVLGSVKYQSHKPEISYVEQMGSTANVTSDVSNLERLNRWVSSWRMLKERPVAGFGPGTYQFEYIPFQDKKYKNRLTVNDPWHIPENSGGTAHSEYILAAGEMGIIGLSALLLFLGRLVWLALEKARGHLQQKNIFIAFAAISTYLFHAFFNNFLNTDKVAILFWGLAAWMFANTEIKTRAGDELLSRNK